MVRILGLSVSRALFFPKAAYFFFFAAMASLAPFLPLYYEQIGLVGRQIGLLMGIPPLLALFSASLFGAVADATQQHKWLLSLAIIVVAAAIAALFLTDSFFWLVPVIVVYAFFLAPIMPLVDKTVLDQLGKRRNQYGKQRLWGAVGWGLAAPVAGIMVERSGLGWAFLGFLAFWLMLLIVSFRLPVGQVNLNNRFWQGLWVLVTNRQWAIFLLVVFITGAGMAIVHNFFFLYLNELGASQSLMGFSLSIATISELLIMYYSERFMGRWAAKTIIVGALLFFIVRAFAYAFISSPALALLVQLLHGPSFAAMWVAGVAHADEIAPPNMRATAQGIFSGVAMGLGSACGAMLGGLLYENFGAASTFLWAGVGMLAGLAIFLAADKGLIKLEMR